MSCKSEVAAARLDIDMTQNFWLRAGIASAISALCVLTVGCSKPTPAEVPVRAVRTLVLGETGGSLSREFAGEIKARSESRMGFRVSGKVLKRDVELGQRVHPGQVLVQLDPQDLALNQESGRAALAAAEANAVQAEADLKRFAELRSQGFVSDAVLERYNTAAKAAQASLRQAKAQAGVQSNQAAYALLTATGAGVVTSTEAEPGQVVSAGGPVVTVALDGPRDAVFSVPEDMAPAMRARVGQAGGVLVRLWGRDEWSPATVREVAASTDSQTRTFLVKADVGRAGGELGQTATIRLNTAVRSDGGLRVPLQAVVEQGGRSAVWVLDGRSMTVQVQAVTTGAVSGNVVLVSQGLKPGQEIVTAGTHVLTPGQKVKRYEGPVKLAAQASEAK